MDLWSDDYTKESMHSTAELLASFSNQLKMRLAPHDHGMTPDDVVFLLDHITSLADAMSNTCEIAKNAVLLKPD